MKTLIASVVAALALLGAALIVAKPWVTIRHAKPIAVKGYAEAELRADTGSLTATVSSVGKSNGEAYTRAGESLVIIEDVISKNLVDKYAVVELGTSIREVMQLNANGKKTNSIDYYTASRSLRINTTDVDGLKKLSRALYDLNTQGIHLDVYGPEFFVSDLEAIKLQLVEEATQNGKARAALMAESSGEELGALISAKQGVIQITKANSTETSSWGVYDTETIDKTIKLVVTLEYEIR